MKHGQRFESSDSESIFTLLRSPRLDLEAGIEQNEWMLTSVGVEKITQMGR